MYILNGTLDNRSISYEAKEKLVNCAKHEILTSYEKYLGEDYNTEYNVIVALETWLTELELSNKETVKMSVIMNRVSNITSNRMFLNDMKIVCEMIVLMYGKSYI